MDAAGLIGVTGLVLAAGLDDEVRPDVSLVVSGTGTPCFGSVQAHQLSIWEGSSDAIALDVLRCLRTFEAHQMIAVTMTEKLAAVDSTDAAPGAQALAEAWAELSRRGDVLLSESEGNAPALIGHYSHAMAQMIMATLLLEQARHEERGAGIASCW